MSQIRLCGYPTPDFRRAHSRARADSSAAMLRQGEAVAVSLARLAFEQKQTTACATAITRVTGVSTGDHIHGPCRRDLAL
jgi:hypothetical protein